MRINYTEILLRKDARGNKEKGFYQLCQGLLAALIHPELQYKHDGLGPHVQVFQLRGPDLEVPSNESSQNPPTTKHLYMEAYHVA